MLGYMNTHTATTHTLTQQQRAARRLQWAIIVTVTVTVIGSLSAPLALRAWTDHTYGDLHYSVAAVPDNYRVAVVFGARVLSNDRLSTVLRDRVATAIDLYHAGKVDVLIMSGDGRTETYNEPRAMQAYAISRGVPAAAIIVDEAGLRTYDTCYRARDVFRIEQAVLVTQDFHLDRALYLCNQLGVDAVGVAADYQRPNGYRADTLRGQNFREVLATTVAFFDLALGTKPSVLGEPQPIALPE